ncbi:MAG: ATP-binding protein [Armatimonadetes bacterium]|nr:ATP-binding protein [Armatimonadota bacterium]
MGDKPLAHLEYPVLGRAYFLGGRASTSLRRALLQAGVEEDVLQRVCVACYEAEMNVVLHARTGYMSVDVWPDRVEVCVTDHGPGIEDVELAMQPGYSTASEEARSLGFGAGMGLPNIRQHADELAIESKVGEGVRLVMTFWRGGRRDGSEQ